MMLLSLLYCFYSILTDIEKNVNGFFASFSNFLFFCMSRKSAPHKNAGRAINNDEKMQSSNSLRAVAFLRHLNLTKISCKARIFRE